VRVTCTPLARAAQSGGAEAPATAPVRTVLAQLQPGATFFEYALIDGGACGEDAFAEAETTLLLLSPQAFRALLEAHAELRLGVLKWMAYGRHQLSVLKLILALPMPLRLHAWLDMLGRQRGQRQDTWLAIPMTLNQQEIAGWLGTTRQYVARAIAGLEGDGRLVRRCDTWLLRRDALPLAAAPALSSADS
jgi:CRP-like cAMP-binding protein